ncbi:unnamed protein product, partial [marine sediment metagenome]
NESNVYIVVVNKQVKPNEKKPEHCQWTDEAYPHIVKCAEDCEEGCDKRTKSN